MNALGQTVVVGHAVDMQVLDAEDPKAIDNAATFLVREIVTPKGDTLMHPRYCLAVLPSHWRAFRKPGMFPLYPCQGLLFLSEEAGVFNRFACRERGKRFQPDINAHLFRSIRQAFGLTLDRKAGVPLTRTAPVDGQRLDLPTDGAVIDHLDSSNLRQDHPIIMRDRKARLRERETIIAISAPEAGIAWSFTGFDTAEECLKSQINANSHILQDLRVDRFQGRPCLLQYRKAIDLVIQGKALAFLLPTITPLLKQMVVEPPAFLKNSVELMSLLFGWVNAILKHFMHTHILAQSRTDVKNRRYPDSPAPNKERRFHPPLESWGSSRVG